MSGAPNLVSALHQARYAALSVLSTLRKRSHPRSAGAGPFCAGASGRAVRKSAREDPTMTWRTLQLATAALALAAPLSAQQDHAHSHGAPERLGTVTFPHACRPEVGQGRSRAMALLHSFGYEEARKAFQQVAEQDPRCGIAQWGVAMTYYHPIWSPPTPEELAAGRAAAEKAQALGAGTDRERAYIAAIGAYYREPDPLARARAYRQANGGRRRPLPGGRRGRDLPCPGAAGDGAARRFDLREPEEGGRAAERPP